MIGHFASLSPSHCQNISELFGVTISEVNEIYRKCSENIHKKAC